MPRRVVVERKLVLVHHEAVRFNELVRQGHRIKIAILSSLGKLNPVQLDNVKAS